MKTIKNICKRLLTLVLLLVLILPLIAIQLLCVALMACLNPLYWILIGESIWECTYLEFILKGQIILAPLSAVVHKLETKK